MQKQALIAYALAGLALLAGIALTAWSPQTRTTLFPAPALAALCIDDHTDGGRSWCRLQPGVSSVAFTYGLQSGAPYPFAGIKIVTLDAQSRGLDLGGAQYLEVGLRADSGVALRISLKSPAPELNRPTDPTARFYHETEYLPFGPDTLKLLKISDLRMPAWWRIREKWPRDQELDRLSEVVEIEVMNGFAPGARDSVRAELRSLVMVSSSPLARGLGLALVALGLITAGLATWKWSLRKPHAPFMVPTVPQEDSRLSLTGAKPVYLPDTARLLQERVLAHLKEHYADPDYSLASLAKGSGLSERAASEALKNATGTHFKGALNELRLTEAARLLDKSRNVSEVAFAVGFNNHSHFTRAFKARYGVSPSEWDNRPVQNL